MVILLFVMLAEAFLSAPRLELADVASHPMGYWDARLGTVAKGCVLVSCGGL